MRASGSGSRAPGDRGGSAPWPRLLPAALATLAALSCAHSGSIRVVSAQASAPRQAAGSEAPELAAVATHTVARGETLWRIARAYGADLEEILAVNGLEESARISVGQTLIIPGPHRSPPPGPLLAEQAPPPAGRPEAAPPDRSLREDDEEGEAFPHGSGAPPRPGPEEAVPLRWPLYGAIHSGFGPRGRRHHDGVDIDAHRGDPIRAAADGRVVFASSRGAYGRTVILDHGDGVSTLYAHASELKVRRGQRVRAGQLIAKAGQTGNAHGSHLHFEVRINGQPVDPLPHLQIENARTGSAR